MILLFDIDGTLAPAMKTANQDLIDYLKLIQKYRPDVRLGLIGGSDAEKAMKQLGEDYRKLFEFCFHENGCVFYYHEELKHKEKLEDFIPQDEVNSLIVFILKLIASSDVPFRTGTFIERRSCTLNVSPIGRNCDHEQREVFFEYDSKHQVRKNMVNQIKKEFPDMPVEIAIGGMISIDIYPKGLNKSHCLQFLPKDESTIHFFGDRCEEGGNDYELFISPEVIGHKVTDPLDTLAQLRSMFDE